MAFNPNIPSYGNVAESDLNAMRENFNQLRKNEAASSFPSDIAAGQFFFNSSDGILYQRNKGNSAWVVLFNTTTGKASASTDSDKLEGKTKAEVISEARSGTCNYATTAGSADSATTAENATTAETVTGYSGGTNYQYLPNGLIVQWGYYVVPYSYGGTVSFPISFSSGVLSVSVTLAYNNSGPYCRLYYSNIGNGSFVIHTEESIVSYNAKIYWIAIGK